MENRTDYDVVIVGGGFAGLTAANLLSMHQVKVLLIEKRTYPFHKVCGEYVSNEVLPFLQSIGLDPFTHGAAKITRLRISTPSGKNIHSPLDLGAFGLSRYKMDHALFELAAMNGTEIWTNSKVVAVDFENEIFKVKTNNGQTIFAALVIGSYGKRDMLDKTLQREFINRHTDYMGVKYHVRMDYPADEVGLDNFDGGYCGMSMVEEGKFNLCYLYKRNERFKFRSIPELEEKVLFKNPLLKKVFSNATFLFDKPEVINEISFAPKTLIENHILMCGDTAGLITPLCGNGMSMAIHSAKLLCELILASGIVANKGISMPERQRLENNYRKTWQRHFQQRLFWGRLIQRTFGNPKVTGLAINGAHSFPALEQWFIKKTHGRVIGV